MMPQFFIRVELHGVHRDSDKYKTLHVAMADRGFSQSAPFEEEWLRLPPAEYFRRGADLTKERVRDDANLAAKATNEAFTVLVVQEAGYAASNLSPGSNPNEAFTNEMMNDVLRQAARRNK